MEAIYKFYLGKKKNNNSPLEPVKIIAEWFNDKLSQNDIKMSMTGMAYGCGLKYKHGAIMTYKNSEHVNTIRF